MTAPAPLRVGYVLKKYPRLSETFVLNEILGVEAAGADVSIYSLTPADEGRFHADLARVKASVTYLPAVGSASLIGVFEAARELAPSAAAFGAALDFVALLSPEKRAATLLHGALLARDARRRGIGHFHAHFATVAAHAALVSRLLGGPTFSVTAHAKDVFRDAVDPRVFRAVAEGAAALVTVCDFNRRFIADKFLAGSSANLVRIYNGLPLSDLAFDQVPREKELVLGVGRLVEKKGFDRLLAASAALAAEGVAHRVVLVGDGEERAALERRAAELGVASRVAFLGPQPRETVLKLMARARVLAAPCVRGDDGNSDALPTVLIEALAAGLPSVATPVAGIPEIVEHEGEGLIVPEDDVPALAAALARSLRDDALHARLSAAGPAKAAARFDRRHTLPELLAVFAGGRGEGATS
jgi:colanic acid/amylovoran biosynthesis glycosyltransferase